MVTEILTSTANRFTFRLELLLSLPFTLFTGVPPFSIQGDEAAETMDEPLNMRPYMMRLLSEKRMTVMRIIKYTNADVVPYSPPCRPKMRKQKERRERIDFGGYMNRTSMLRVLLGVVMCIVPLATASFAQGTNATVTGIITDQTSGIVVGATVEMISSSTNVSSTATTNKDGLYRISGLIPGIYTARVSMSGFKTETRKAIELHVQDDVSMNFTLQVGATSESITVESGEPLLQTQSSSLSQVVEGRTVQDMPLNGRNVMNLVALTPGVVAQGTTSGNPVANQTNGSFTNPNGWGNYQIGGGFANQSATLIDGASINTSYTNSVSLVPTQDAIGEFRVSSNAVSPEYGRFAGGVINLSTKSGGNDFHGSVYEYIRNKVLNANYYFNNATGLARPAFTQNQYGATIGGPIKRDKAFFFFSWEGFGLRTASPQILSVPTAAMRSGDLSALGVNIYDPYTTTSNGNGGYTRTQLSCNGQANVICPNRIDPTSAVVLNFFPSPNLPGTANNYAVDPSTGGNSNQYNGRVDYSLSDKQRLFARYTYWNGTTLAANPFNNTTGTPGPDFTTHQVVLGDTYTINSTTVADFRVSYLRFLFNAEPPSNGTDLSMFGPAYAALADQFTFHQNPLPEITGFTSTAWANQDLTILNTSDNYTVSANITKMLGRHNLTFGGEARKIEWYYAQDNYGSGVFTFDNGFTAQNPLETAGSGNAYASYLLGTPSSGYVDNVNRTSALQWYAAAYVNDAFQVTPKLLINAGVRWEQPGEFYEKHDRLDVLLPGATNPLGSAVGMDLTGTVALANTPAYGNRTMRDLSWDLFAPRAGFAYRWSDTTVVRGGYGLEYLPNDVAFAAAPFNMSVNNSQTNMATSLDGGLTPYATFSNPFSSGVVQPIGNNASQLNLLDGGTPNGTLVNQTKPYTQQWNLNVEQQLGSKTIFSLGYAGAKGNHLPLFLMNLDQLPDQYDSMGAALLNNVTNPFLGHISPTAGLLGVSPTLPAGFLLKPQPQYLAYLADGPYWGNALYHSLQATLKHQFGAGGNLMVAYTWSKLISDVDSLTAWLEESTPGGQYGAQDAFDRKAERSLSANDVPQNLVVSYVADVPLGKGKRFGSNMNGFENALLGGWSVNGVSTFRSGFPLGMSAQATILSTYFGAGTPRPDYTPGCNRKITGSAQSRLNGWFNTACFTEPNTFGFGDESREDSQLRAAGVANWDFGLFKAVPVHERFNVQFRAEVFNLANRVQFAPPGTTLDTPQFGVVLGQANQPRLYQFSLRLNY